MSNILLLAGDGIGPEIMAQAKKVIDAIGLSPSCQTALVGGASFDDCGEVLSEQTLELARQSDAILLGAVGGEKWQTNERDNRPEKALLRLRSELDLFANLRPALCFEGLENASSLEANLVKGLDILIVRELTGGLYFGKPRGIRQLDDGQQEGFNTLVYRQDEIKRIAKVAFEAAQKRSLKLTSVDKANVLEVMELWRDEVSHLHSQYPSVELNHLYVDNAVMQLIKEPKQFDVLLCDNLFGDILSDAAAQLTGSIGLLPSASLNGDNKGMFEPVHGSAPDIAGKDCANPIAMVLSLAMMLRYSLGEMRLAEVVEDSVMAVLKAGHRTIDLVQNNGASTSKAMSCSQMGDLIQAQVLQHLEK